MIDNIEHSENGYIIGYNYDMGELVQMVSDRTQAVSVTLVDKDGIDSFELMSATEDNMWELHRYANDAWSKVCAITRRYHCCVPTIPDRDNIYNRYSIVLRFPVGWMEQSALPINQSILDYMVSYMTQKWWMAKGHTAQAEIEMHRVADAESELRYSMNTRSNYNRTTQWL